jgi:4-diphosphocytidyl-2-C-methyl-D-erythritol kinase
MNRLYDLGLPQAQLVELGAQLGSDVVFFLYGGTAFGSGRGEQIRPLTDISPVWVVLVNPGIHVSSGWAYKKLNLKLTNFQGIISVLPEFREDHVTGEQPLFRENMLERPVIHEYPVIQEIKEALQTCGAEWAMMSGSGSTVFGIFKEKTVAEQARQRMKQPGWLVVLTRTKQRTTAHG